MGIPQLVWSFGLYYSVIYFSFLDFESKPSEVKQIGGLFKSQEILAGFHHLFHPVSINNKSNFFYSCILLYQNLFKGAKNVA